MTAQQRHHLHRRVRRLQRQEFLLAEPLGQAEAGPLRANARKKGQLERSAQLKRAAGLVLHQALQLVLVTVGVEGQREVDRAGDGGHADNSGRPESPFDQFFHSINTLSRSRRFAISLSRGLKSLAPDPILTGCKRRPFSPRSRRTARRRRRAPKCTKRLLPTPKPRTSRSTTR